MCVYVCVYVCVCVCVYVFLCVNTHTCEVCVCVRAFNCCSVTDLPYLADVSWIPAVVDAVPLLGGVVTAFAHVFSIIII